METLRNGEMKWASVYTVVASVPKTSELPPHENVVNIHLKIKYSFFRALDCSLPRRPLRHGQLESLKREAHIKTTIFQSAGKARKFSSIEMFIE